MLLPSLIKRDFAHRTGLMTGLCTMAITGGATLAAGITGHAVGHAPATRGRKRSGGQADCGEGPGP